MTRARRILLVLAALSGIGAGVGYAATLAVTSTHLWAGTQALTKSSCTLTGTSQTTDTYVDATKPSNQFGTSTTLLVKPSSSQTTFVQFDLSSCAIPTSGGADTATLKLRITSAPNASRTLTVAPVLSSWSGTLTASQAGGLSMGSATTTFSTGKTNNVTVNVSVTVDVDALIKGATRYGWAITDTGSTGSGSNTTTSFASSEASSNQPQLVINYEK